MTTEQSNNVDLKSGFLKALGLGVTAGVATVILGSETTQSLIAGEWQRATGYGLATLVSFVVLSESTKTASNINDHNTAILENHNKLQKN